MSVETELKEIVYRHLGHLVPTPNGWKKRNCPLCVHLGHSPDKRERFGILETADGGITVNCFNCGFMTGWKPGSTLGKKMVRFLEMIGVSRAEIDALKFQAFRESHGVETKREIAKKSITSKWTPLKQLPKDFASLAEWASKNCTDKDFLKVTMYADKRKLLEPEKIFWTPEKKHLLRKRMILPYLHEGKIVGYTGRIFNDETKVEKYYHIMPPQYIYGLDNQRENQEYVIISEGVFDAYVTKGIGILHNKLHDDQATLIEGVAGEKILCPDKDKDSESLIETAIERGWSVAFPKWGKDDKGKVIKDASRAAEIYGRVATIQSIIESKERDPSDIKIRRKMERLDYGY